MLQNLKIFWVSKRDKIVSTSLCFLDQKFNGCIWSDDYGRRLLGCSTGGCSTIQIEQKLFDNLKSWDVRLKLCSTKNQQLSNIKLIELNQKDDYVRLIIILTLKMDNC